MAAQKFDEIMRQITSNLTGDSEKDIPYLMEQSEMYKDHEMNKEITRACGRLIYELLPEDKKKEINRVYDNEMASVQSTLEEVRFNIYENKLDKALNLMEGLIEKVESVPMFDDDEVSDYFSFNELFEEMLYVLTRKPQKDIRRASVPYAEVYFQYGSLLFELKRYIDAREALEKAMRWNPMHAGIAFEHAETYKVVGEIDKTEALTKEIFKIAFKPEDVARCYRNLGYIYIEKKMIREAVACYYMSMQYEPDSRSAQSELYYIQQTFNAGIDAPSLNEMKDISKRCGFPMGADKDVLGIAYSLGKKFLDEKQYDMAEYLLQIAYDLTDDEDIAKMLEFIPQNDDKLN